MYEVTYILGGNIELDVKFTYIPGKAMIYGQTNEDSQPAEDEEIEIQSVTCSGKEVDIDDIYIGVRCDDPQTLNSEIIEFISTNRSEWLDQ